ncbi:urease accessory protein UreE [Pelagovum pacificum]|uniref:Urease accessory protein UreE n=1 Tax=Pelagovum pacificum TaxID=2588711 RepID=A0A5C5GBH1_9RHOB|nr:urease accessory protein UreE [Pelagovum pacificum]QQA42238.1 urease accessory protein UreE [Pelagovum pacificum]TNY31322.1 urease accessory protein UreE [Pelagovum pacificum]
MTDLPAAGSVLRAADRAGKTPFDLVPLTYDERMLRRRRLVTAHDEGFLVDLPQTVSVDQGDCFALADGRLVEVIAAEEELLEVSAGVEAVARIAWHIGNRHAPAQIESGEGTPRILIRRDPVLAKMLEQLGATVTEVREPFRPEGGAYGVGRTMGHSHGDGHSHAHDHHDHTHDHHHRDH